jgi:DNA-binding NarL/FixJ family response regulator
MTNVHAAHIRAPARPTPVCPANAGARTIDGGDGSGARIPAARVTPNTGWSRPRYLIVDDNLDFARCLAKTLHRWGDAAIAGSVREAREVLGSCAWGALFVDVGLLDGTGFDVIKPFRVAHPKTAVLVLDGGFNQDSARKACELGSMYMPKPISTAAIELFVALAVSFEERLAQVVQAWAQRYGLSAAECDVLFRAAQGQSRSLIAEERVCTPQTLKQQVHGLLGKTGHELLLEAVSALLRELAQ